MKRVPTLLTLRNGSQLTLWSYGQLELLNRGNLKSRALDLHNAAGELSPRAELSLPPPALVLWVIELQCALSASLGVELSPSDLGVPADRVRLPEDARVCGWAKVPNVASKEAEFTYNEASFPQAAATATVENKANRQMNRGTLDTFMFGGGQPENAPPAPHRVVPPYQTNPYARPGTATGKASVSTSSFQPPPPRAYHQQNELPEFVGDVGPDIWPVLPPLKR